MNQTESQSTSRLGRNPFHQNQKITPPAEKTQSKPESDKSEKTETQTHLEPETAPHFFTRAEEFVVKAITFGVFVYAATKRAIEILKEPIE